MPNLRARESIKSTFYAEHKQIEPMLNVFEKIDNEDDDAPAVWLIATLSLVNVALLRLIAIGDCLLMLLGSG